MLGSRRSVADHYERLKRDRLSAAKRQRSLAVRIAKSIQGAAEAPRDSTSTFASLYGGQADDLDELLGFPRLGCKHVVAKLEAEDVRGANVRMADCDSPAEQRSGGDRCWRSR